ncbi:hypothetical protein PVAND_004823 [Polypedilum vanderplanki]|uniref:EGF-like domain-containing protein n=1 Tax=Polypedilum vanderplanki TaxID=319348 RepID=A0A9J6C084_POLVA|nr:hypothetical protein PVAND_004823 [Polypedilum vanderplanki]
MNFLKFILAIFILNCIWFATDACNSLSDDEVIAVAAEADTVKNPYLNETITYEGCFLNDGSPYCLHGGDCYRISSRPRPTCMCIEQWWGRRCNILRSEYNVKVDRWQGDFI